ncbi:MAG: AAA family ATPase [Candidatus Bathyarchaeota archaeon]|nr:MAG: AAA family ATPase [Candidatus Bathyarchaeota archaeon]
MLIQEIILENFMSYEYARVPFKPGVNVVCGPNGSGKSSMLIGVSVALGQSYTERSRKLSDLIRWGKDQARVTLVLDNSPRKGRRPVPRIRKDQIFLTRGLRRDGKYWFELDNRAATRSRVVRLLSKLGVDPENILIIMHQNMVEQFTVLSPEDKLRTVEAAVGFESYRQNVLRAQRKLSRTLSQEESVGKLLESAEQTLTYWREQYDRYQQKKQLRLKRRFLERELAWAEAARREKTVSDLKKQMQKKRNEVSRIDDETKNTNSQLDKTEAGLKQVKEEQKGLFQEILRIEYERAGQESSVSLANQALEDMRYWTEMQETETRENLNRMQQLENTLQEIVNPVDVRGQLSDIKRSYKDLESTWTQRFTFKSESLKKSAEDSSRNLEEMKSQISDLQAKRDHSDREIERIYDEIVDCRVNLALLQYRKRVLVDSLDRLERALQISLSDLDEAEKKAGETGLKIAVIKSIEEILDEMRVTDGHLAALADVSEDIERMYESYSKLYLDLKEKARLAAENREKALGEVKERMRAWRTVIKNLLDHVNPRYQGILSQAQAIGEVRLFNETAIEEAGLQILVGFKGSKPVPLDAYTQSGGERSTATISFLLALQQRVRSQFRAVDEYDIHLDPRSRELIADMIVSTVGGEEQFLAITPSQLTFTEKDVHIITVQNVEGTSVIKEML